MSDKIKLDLQTTLDDLFTSKLIPFKLVAHKVTEDFPGVFRVHFYDARIHSVTVGIRKAETIASQLRSAVLGQLSERSESLAEYRRSGGNKETPLLAFFAKRPTC